MRGTGRACPTTMRMVVVLRDVYDLPHEAIARELGISQTAAKVRLHRARRRLREQLFSPAGTPGMARRSRQRAGIGASPAHEDRAVALIGASAGDKESSDRAAV